MSEKKSFGSRLSSIFNQSNASSNEKKSLHSSNSPSPAPSSSQQPCRYIPKSPSPAAQAGPAYLSGKPQSSAGNNSNNNRSVSSLSIGTHPGSYSERSLHSKSSASTLQCISESQSYGSSNYSTATTKPAIHVSGPEQGSGQNLRVQAQPYARSRSSSTQLSSKSPVPGPSSGHGHGHGLGHGLGLGLGLGPSPDLPTSPPPSQFRPSPSDDNINRLAGLDSPPCSASESGQSITSPRLRRKSPSDWDSFDFEDENNKNINNPPRSPSSRQSDSAATSEYSKLRSESLEPRGGEDIMADLGNEIDNFLQLEDSQTDESSGYGRGRESESIDRAEADIFQDTPSPNRNMGHEVGLNRSSSVRSYGYGYGDVGEERPLSYHRYPTEAPYPTMSPIDSPFESKAVTPTESVENSPNILQSYLMESPESERDPNSNANLNPFERNFASPSANPFDSASSRSSQASASSPTQIQRFDYSTNPSTSSSATAPLPQSSRSPFSRTSSRMHHSNSMHSHLSNAGLPSQSHQPMMPPPLQHQSTETSQYSYANASINSFGRQGSQRRFHRVSSSVGSIRSSNSYRHVNLAALKKTISLKPGEGERSYYVLTIRRNAGTAFNENGPSRWKLPVGISPIDKAATKENSNGKYKKLAGSTTSSRMKTSGVELKHGHLKPRLLATEIEEGDNSPSINMNRTPVSNSSANILRNVNSQTSSSTRASRENSLKRTTTDASMLTGDTQSIVSINTGSTKANTNEPSLKRTDSTDSSGSDQSVSHKITGYYQHRGYKYGDEDDEMTERMIDHEDSIHNASQVFSFHGLNGSGNMDDTEEDKPRLVLANPDTDSDTA
ncbi:uncharacterized protein LODBEIA_P17120 [Lodderomyces beijingensis]|uniref:Uncharacterized protein n=1 Tax=Lodderomyces beijingensis TaxID=1775926 RepID=A0ABP0ZIM9_9ASCO